MEKKKLDWIISLIREDMGAGAVSGPPTNHTGPHVAEFSPVMGKPIRRKKKFIKLPAGSRKRWMKKGES